MTTIPRPNGASATSIWTHLTGQGKQNGDYPMDAGDFGSCEAFLQANPELRAEFPRMAEVNAYWEALVPRWDALCGTDPGDLSEIIRRIVKPIEAIDPSCGKMGPNVTIRSGPITFKGLVTDPSANQSPDTIPEAVARIRENMEKLMPAGTGHNSSDPYAVTADELRQFIERYEQLESEKKDITEQQKELMAEAKGRGYDTKVMRKVIALRKRKPDELAEEEAVLEVYKAALGMS